MKNGILNLGIASLFAIFGLLTIAQGATDNSVPQMKCAPGKCGMGMGMGKSVDVNTTKKTPACKTDSNKKKCKSGKCKTTK